MEAGINRGYVAHTIASSNEKSVWLIPFKQQLDCRNMFYHRGIDILEPWHKSVAA